jgi:hypothetical protein
LLDWAPRVQLRDELAPNIAYFDEMLSRGDLYKPKRVGVV